MVQSRVCWRDVPQHLNGILGTSWSWGTWTSPILAMLMKISTMEYVDECGLRPSISVISHSLLRSSCNFMHNNNNIPSMCTTKFKHPTKEPKIAFLSDIMHIFQFWNAKSFKNEFILGMATWKLMKVHILIFSLEPSLLSINLIPHQHGRIPSHKQAKLYLFFISQW
jgi:hypothetical protein